MIFQKQTKIHNPSKGTKGNCMVTCYANYLDIPVGDCPAFEELFDCKKPNGFWWDAVQLWWNMMGYTIQYAGRKEDIPADVLSDVYFVSGISPRNSTVHHLVIYKNGKLLFDPHPDGTGIVEGTEVSWEWVKKN